MRMAKKKSETNWKAMERHGKSISWYENGQKEAEIIYKNGSREEENQWNEDGELQ